VVRERESLLVPELDEAQLAASAVDAEHRAMMETLGMRSAMVAPIVVGGRSLGVISFVRTEASQAYSEADLALAEELARRAATAIENARLFSEAEERAQAAQALTFVADGVALVDRRGIVRLWNPAAEAITSMPRSAVVGRPADVAISGWTELVARVSIASSGAEPASVETLPLELEGREVWLSISGVDFEEGTVFAFRDVTAERNVDQLKSDFVSTVSHELRTPLAAIYGAAVTLRRGDLSLSGDQRYQLLGVVANEADRLARIVNDILWASRVESGTLSITIESCDPVQLVEDVVEAQRLHLPPTVSLRVSMPDELPPVAADPDKIRQVLVNLLDNAVKYSPDGGEVELALGADNGRLRFSVRDQGLGIPASEQGRVFEKFYRLDPNLTRGVGGTGLGLYICRELVRRMDGRIVLESQPGEGSTFTVDLPIADG
jgi:signal transduction histidine kinase